MDMADITKTGSLMVKTAKDGTETWIFPITSTDNITHHDTEQLDEYLDAMEKSIVKTDATQTQHGLLSTDDKKKLDGIASGATKVTVDTSLSTTSTNPVQNKAVKAPLDKKSDSTHTHTKSDIGLGNVENKSSATIRGEITSDNIITALTYTPAKNVNMTAASSTADGKAGLVPAPTKGKQTAFLRGDGTWVIPTNTTYDDVTQSTHGLMTAADKTKLDGIADGATKVTVDSEMSSTSTNPVQNKAIQAALDGKSNTDHTHTKADIGLGNVENKSSATIRGELTKENVTTALGYTPPTTNTTYNDLKGATASAAGTHGLVPAPAAGKQLSFLRGDGTWVVPTNTTYNDATQSDRGLMTAADKTKLDGITTGATKVTVDETLSETSTNAIQNKAVQAAINAVSTKVDNIIKDAPEAYDTFKEISEYISSHKTEYDALLAVSNNKVDKVDGKGLSTNDFTTELKTKLDGIAAEATKVTVDSEMSSTSTNPVQNKAIQAALDKKVTAVSGKGLSTNDFTAAYKTKLDALTNLEIVTSLPSSVTSDSSYLLIDSAETA